MKTLFKIACERKKMYFLILREKKMFSYENYSLFKLILLVKVLVYMNKWVCQKGYIIIYQNNRTKCFFLYLKGGYLKKKI